MEKYVFLAKGHYLDGILGKIMDPASNNSHRLLWFDTLVKVPYGYISMSDTTCHILTVIDGETEDLLDLIEIREFNLTQFVLQFDVPAESDPEMLDRYAVGPDDVDFLRTALGLEVQFDFTRYGYFIEAATKHG